MPITYPPPLGDRRLLSGKYYDLNMFEAMGATTTFTVVADTLYASLIKVPYAATLDRLACHIATGAAAGKLVRMGLYADGSDQLPGALLVDGGTAAADVTGATTVTVSHSLAAGWYWVALVSDGAPVITAVTNSTAGRFASGQTSLGGGSGTRGASVSRSQAFGALPSSFGASSAAASSFLRLGYRVA